MKIYVGIINVLEEEVLLLANDDEEAYQYVDDRFCYLLKNTASKLIDNKQELIVNKDLRKKYLKIFMKCEDVTKSGIFAYRLK